MYYDPENLNPSKPDLLYSDSLYSVLKVLTEGQSFVNIRICGVPFCLFFLYPKAIYSF